MESSLFKCLLFLFLLLYAETNLHAQNKKALIIAISHYKDKNWYQLSSDNDALLVKEMLKKQSFSEKDIEVLSDEQATAYQISLSFEKIISAINQGDVFYFHFSGHGQLIEDVSREQSYDKIKIKDEMDGFDEALVTVNAPKNWTPDYHYEEHFSDDQLHYYFSRIRKKLGSEGQLIAVFDCCHSGTATRGMEDEVVRGTDVICAPPSYSPENKNSNESKGFDADMEWQNGADMGSLTAFYACQSSQMEREIQDDRNFKFYGALTYLLVKSMEQLGPHSSYNNLFSKINEGMVTRFQNLQNPAVEGNNLNELIFKGTFLPQDPYFKITSINNDSVEINGGSMHGISVGDSVGFYSNSCLSVSSCEQLFSGVVKTNSAFSSTVTIPSEKKLSAIDSVRYRIFQTKISFGTDKLKVRLEINNKGLLKRIKKELESRSFITITSADCKYTITDTIINGKPDFCLIYAGKGKEYPLRNMSPVNMDENTEGMQQVTNLLQIALQADKMRSLQQEDARIPVRYKLYDCNKLGIIGKTCGADTLKELQGNIRISDRNHFHLVVTNPGTETAYVNLIDIMPDGQMQWMKNYSNATLYRNNSIECIVTVSGPPYGMEQIKLIAGDRPTDYSSINKMGSSLSNPNVNPLQEFVSTDIKTRGNNEKGNLGATTHTITFEITRK